MNDIGMQPEAAADEPVVVDKGITTGLPNVAFFTENETGLVVKVETFFAWGPYELTCAIEYPAFVEGGHPKRFGMPARELPKYFTVVSPQEIFMSAFGGVYDRPTPKQREFEQTARE